MKKFFNVLKKIFAISFILFLSFILIVAGLSFLFAAQQKSDFFTGVVERRYLENGKARNGKTVNTKTFVLKLEDFSEKLEWFTPSENYEKLLLSISKGDSLTVEYSMSHIRSISKQNKKIIKYDKIFNKDLILGLIILIVGIGMFVNIIVKRKTLISKI